MRLISIVLLLVCSYVEAKIDSQIELLSPLRPGLNRVQGKYVTQDNKEIILIGTSRVADIPKSKEKVIRILWTELDSKDEAKYLAKPVLMTMVSGKMVNKGAKLKVKREELTKALDKLQRSKSKVKVQDEKTSARVVLDMDGISHDQTSIADGMPESNIGAVASMDIHSSNDSDMLDIHGNRVNEASGGQIKPKMGINTRYPIRRGRNNADGNSVYSPLGITNSDSGLVEMERSPSNVTLDQPESMGLDEAAIPASSSNEREARGSENIRIEITCDGCEPRIDNANSRVIIQNKAITYKNDEIQKQTECTDSMEWYAIQRDYLCQDCSDVIDFDEGKAYATYERYWTGADGIRHVVSNSPEKDIEQAFPLVNERGDCHPYVDLNEMQAFPQVELVYRDRVNTRKVARACYREDNASSTPIELTSDKCTPTHDFGNNWSILQQRGIFDLDGKLHQAFPCKEVGYPVPHDYDTGVCNVNVNLGDASAAVMGRRYVILEGERNYLSDCEPVGKDQALMESVEGCEGNYIHDFAEGRSYLQKRWYYLDGMEKQFVTNCQKSIEYLPHQIEVTGYEHDDGNRRSKQITTVYLEPNELDQLILQENYISPNAVAIPYEQVTTIDEPTEDSRFDGCHRVTQTNRFRIFNRPDGSEYRLFLGIGTPVTSEDLCQRTTENRDVYSHSLVVKCHGHTVGQTNKGPYETIYLARMSTATRIHDPYMSFQGSGEGLMVMHQRQRRTKTTYPNGHVQYSSWSNTGSAFVKEQFVPGGPNPNDRIALRVE